MGGPGVTPAQLGDGATMVMPKRDVPGLGFVGGMFLGFGFLAIAGPWTAVLVFDAFDVFMAVGFSLVGTMLMVLGCFAKFGRSEIRVDHGTIYARERGGPFWWTRKRPLRGLKQLRVIEAQMESNNRPLHGFGHLVGEFETGKDFYLALAHKVEVLEHAARDFAPYLGLDTEDAPIEVETPKQTRRRRIKKALVEQPRSSKAILEHNDVGLMLTLPPAGLVRGSKGLFIFGTVWTVFIALMTIGLLGADAIGEDGDGWLALLILIPFWLVGGVVLTIAINMGRRRALIGVIHDKLAIKRTNLFGTKTHEWHAANIELIDVEASSMRVNNSPVPQLAIHAGGDRLGLWTGRDEQELKWIAAVLNDALGLYDDEDEASA